jgi:hypothetical protein
VDHFKQFFLVALFLSLAAGSSTVEAVAFSLTDFRISTETLVGINLTEETNSAPALPADTSFTLIADAVVNLPPNPSNTFLSNSEGKFLRYTFSLPAGFHDLTFMLEANINDEFAVYVNDTVVAIQGTTSSTNFDSPLPGLSLNVFGTAMDTSGKLEYLMASGMQSLFHAGTNELTLFGTDRAIYGGISAINGTITAVPEANVYAMMLAGLWLMIPITRKRGQRKETKGVTH